MRIDFGGGRTAPRSGRAARDGFLWLARVVDKARAAAAGTLGDYVYPCPIDRGMLARWGRSAAELDAAIARLVDDAAVAHWLTAACGAAERDAANAWLLAEWAKNLDRQDAEERPAEFALRSGGGV